MGTQKDPFDPEYSKTMEAQMSSSVPKCSLCKRERTLGDGEHPMDAYDYAPMQVMTGKPLGWYSGDDGGICPEEMEKMVRGQVG